MKQKFFWIGAGIGFALILIYLCASTREADITTVQNALTSLDSIKPFEGWNTISFLYFILATLPVAFAASCGGLCIAAYAFYRFLQQYATKMDKIAKK